MAEKSRILLFCFSIEIEKSIIPFPLVFILPRKTNEGWGYRGDNNQQVTFSYRVYIYGFFGWNIWRQPIGFLVFLISSLAECERLPFDLPEAKEELVAGYQTEYSVLYLGRWDLSIPYISFFDFFQMNKAVGILEMTIGIFITLTKAYLFLFISITIRWTLPRMKIDQLLNPGWKFLLPISLGNLLLTSSSQLVSL
ncbi:hypothetical protein BRADI_2g03103v3 [Brachypodium distachyon]|uniref:NADH-plastoquinone oxidoreductase subunit 1 n=1 Tax=Brachypodium distachyon TaxID=15368 RepID=A0A0Q3QMJ8_BRADI|nr:hypothetical protein BRADI_2g03103v3 [Brachypodium distachyon]